MLHYPLDAFKHPSQGTGLYLPFSRRFEPMNEELDAHISLRLPQRTMSSSNGLPSGRFRLRQSLTEQLAA